MQNMIPSPIHNGGNSRSGMSTLKFVMGLLLWTMVLGALYFVIVQKINVRRAQDGNSSLPESTSQSDAPLTNDDALEPIEVSQKTAVISFPSRELPDFVLSESMGQTLGLKDLIGKRWLANFIFTRCAGPCPMMTRDISELHRQIGKTNPDFRFVTFTVDPEHDTVDVLKKYAETFRADHERWKFLTGSEAEILNLIRGGFMQYVQPNIGESRTPGFEVAHSNRAVLVNEDGIPVASFVMTVAADVAKLRRIIEGKADFPVPGPGLTFSVSSGDNPPVPFTLVPADNGDAEDAPGDAEETPMKKDDSEETPANNENSPETPQSKNKKIDQLLPQWAANMPTINAGLNSACIVLLCSGLVAIKSGNRIRHRNLMIVSFVVSVAFLVCYLTYHEVLYRFTGHRGRAFDGSTLATRLYFSILIPHVILAAIVPILALRVFYLAFKERWPEHRRLAKITLPIWLFVSITGVVIYGMLYHWPWSDVTVS